MEVRFLKVSGKKFNDNEKLFKQIKTVGKYLAERYNLPKDVNVTIGYQNGQWEKDEMMVKFTFSTDFKISVDDKKRVDSN